MSHAHCEKPCRLRSGLAVSPFLIFILTSAAQAQETIAPQLQATLKRGQVLHLSLSTDLDSGHARVGDDVSLKLVAPLKADGKIILRVGWTVHGVVTRVKRAGKNCRYGQVSWKLIPIETPSGERARVQRVESYPWSPVPGEPEWVPLDTPLKKIGRGFELAGATAIVVALAPLIVPMAIAMTEKCDGAVGQEEFHPPGTRFLAAVSRNARVTVLQEPTKEPTSPQ